METPALQKLGGRKFVVTVVTGIANAGLLVFGFIDSSAYVTLTLGTVGVYIAGNAVQKWVEHNGTAPINSSWGQADDSGTKRAV